MRRARRQGTGGAAATSSQPCDHGQVIGNLCAKCGQTVVTADSSAAAAAAAATDEDEQEKASVDVALVTMAGGGTMRLSAEAARQLHSDKADRLLKNLKLSLVLDLDNTLLHATPEPSASTYRGSDCFAFDIPGVAGVHYIKMRPHLQHFLQQAAKNFELTIYTAGTRQYAERVAARLDPTNELFSRRIISATDTVDLGRSTKSLSRIFPGSANMALIVDDREDVWRGPQSRNLLLVRPYIFWRSQLVVNNDPGAIFGKVPNAGASNSAYNIRSSSNSNSSCKNDSNTKAEQQQQQQQPSALTNSELALAAAQEGTHIQTSDTPSTTAAPPLINSLQTAVAAPIDVNEREETDPQLLCILQVLEEVHDRFYSTPVLAPGEVRDCAELLSAVKSEVLAGVRLVFSGVIPLQEAGHAVQSGGDTPAVQQQQHPLCRFATDIGATVDTAVTAQTTHVVAAQLGSAKTLQGLAVPGCVVVHVDWLMFSVWHCRREDERMFMLSRKGTQHQPLPLTDTAVNDTISKGNGHSNSSANNGKSNGDDDSENEVDDTGLYSLESSDSDNGGDDSGSDYDGTTIRHPLAKRRRKTAADTDNGSSSNTNGNNGSSSSNVLADSDRMPSPPSRQISSTSSSTSSHNSSPEDLSKLFD
jgi:RNA polymerase II subunit A C-terminal domain phosphatase